MTFEQFDRLCGRAFAMFLWAYAIGQTISYVRNGEIWIGHAASLGAADRGLAIVLLVFFFVIAGRFALLAFRRGRR